MEGGTLAAQQRRIWGEGSWAETPSWRSKSSCRSELVRRVHAILGKVLLDRSREMNERMVLAEPSSIN